MNKKTITTFALTAASLAFALTPPPVATKTMCLDTREDADGALRAGTCDQARNNETTGAKLLKNGCAEGQVSLVGVKYQGSQQYTINVPYCLPPGAVQL